MALFIQRCKNDEPFRLNVVARPRDLTDAIRADIASMKTGKKDQDHRKYIFYGYSGWGKSADALCLACWVNPKFKRQFIFYEKSKALDRLPKMRQFSIIFMDEKKDEHGIGSSIEADEFNNLAEQCRDYSISLIACANSKWDFEYHYAFEILPGFIDFDKHIARAFVQNPAGDTIGFCDFPFIGDSNKKLWRQYLSVKKKAARARMKKSGTGKWETRLKALLKFRIKGHKSALFTEIRQKYKTKDGELRIPREVCIEMVDMAFPSWGRDVRTYELAAKLHSHIRMGLLK